jgi:hypothetical protein
MRRRVLLEFRVLPMLARLPLALAAFRAADVRA